MGQRYGAPPRPASSWAPPGEVHWHGAAPDSFINHTAISLGDTDWAEAVDDEHYGAAFEGE